MIRFAIKCALGLGLLAMVLPLGSGEADKGSGLDMFGMAVGFQEAVSDLGGFCTRAPAACAAGRQLVAFAGERIEEGMRIGYGFVSEKLAPASANDAVPATPPSIVAAPVRPAAVETASNPPQPQPYQAPKRQHPVRAEIDADDAGALPAKVPAPQPRG